MESQIVRNDFGHITQKTNAQGIQLLEISHTSCNARICLHGGHVLDWQPVGFEPILWLSKQAQYQAGAAIRGGIPICWPWFGNRSNENSHGFARTQSWQLVNAKVTVDAVVIELMLAGEQQASTWPYAFRLKQELSFSKVFSQKMVVENTSKSDFEFGHAFHSYFRVSDPEQVTISDLNNSCFDDKITGKLKQKSIMENCKGPLDRIYYNHETQHVDDKLWQRRITVESVNCHHWVVWNPGHDVAVNMKDVHPFGEKEYVCLEAANVEMQTVKSGKSIAVSQRISVNPL